MGVTAFDLPWLLEALTRRGLLEADQAEEARRREAVQRAAILREKDRAGLRRGAPAYQVSPSEVLASLRLTGPRGELDLDRIMEAVAAESGLPYEKIDPTRLDLRWITGALSRPFARKHCVLPLRRQGDEMWVAVENPFDHGLFETLRGMTRATIRPVLTSKADILRLIAEIYGFRSSVRAAEKDFGGGPGAAVDLGNLEQFFSLKSVDAIEADDKHVINAIDFLLHYALDQRASDIHVEPKREHGQVRLRIDGVLHSTHRVPRVVHPAFVARIKTMARLDIAEKRKPQDGRIKVDYHGKEVEIRVSTMPVAFGEKLVLRILDPDVLLTDLEDLGFYPDELAAFERFLAEPSGIVVICGPTGSGKTTTLYSALRSIAEPGVNVVTVEDPVEMVVEDFNQSAVQPRIDLTFAALTRTLLRQDPDVIMVGEVRDPETAQQAIQAALTGHLVLTSLHTRDSAGAVTRLIDLGVEPFLIASTLLGVVSQRLVRRVCERCREEVHLSSDECAALGLPAERAEGLVVAQGRGCTHCRGTGYKGRTGVFEVLRVTDRVRTLIKARADAPTLTRTARQDGMMTLRECAVRKLADGMTAFEEVVRATSDVEER
jgi:general secretion pathway protein E